MKKIVGVLMGGYSSEFEISLKSGQMVFDALDLNLFTPFKVHILKRGWFVLHNNQELNIDKNDFSFTLNDKKIKFDVLFNAIHGTPGEDGYLQGYLKLLNLKHTSCGQFSSALTMNKAKCNILLKQWGVVCAESIFLMDGQNVIPAEAVKKLGLPLFVKPNRSGSSFGVSKVKSADEVLLAVAEARKEDQQVLLESAVIGKEVGCGVARLNGKISALAITELISKNEFFDYQAKYEGAAQEITPAEIGESLTSEIMQISEFVYQALDLKGVVRIDFIINQKNQPYLIEVNSVPGLSPESIVPQQVTYAGYSLQEFFTLLLQEALK